MRMKRLMLPEGQDSHLLLNPLDAAAGKLRESANSYWRNILSIKMSQK